MRWILIGLWSLFCFIIYSILQGGFSILDWLIDGIFGPGHHVLDGVTQLASGVGSFLLTIVWLGGCLLVLVLAKVISFSLAQQQAMQQATQSGQRPPPPPGFNAGPQSPPPFPGAGPIISADYRRVDEDDPKN